MSNQRILIVDDEELIANALQEFFTQAGFEVETAANGDAALRKFMENPFDLLIVDILMPEKDGIATIMDLQKQEKAPKIIAISGGGNVIKNFDYLEYAQALGAVKCFQKPLDPNEILDSVRTAFL